MARVRSVDFLPEIFQTDVNKQFLAATLDQLIQEPKFKKTQGFIGRTVGPGVNPNDKYVIEPNKVRADYQLEPGVISLVPDTNTIKNAITYPGINDAVGYQGGDQTRPDRLYDSEFYTWDPFVDFDTFVNFSQYFWLPTGPDAVDVAATGIPASDNFVVDRANGVYTFSGIAGDNPVIELVRGGSYTFQVAQNAKETVNYRVQNTGTSAYKIDQLSNPVLTLSRGNTYVFNLNLNGVFPFWIKTAETLGTGDAYNSGVSRNGATIGLITFTVPQDAPDTLYYVSENQTNMRGQINIINGTPGTGEGFWIQSAPGVNGISPVYSNISTRDVYGVENNGEDLGTITFNVPLKDAQSFYYNLESYGTVDLVTNALFDQINNQPLADIQAAGGIDGITSLNNRTLVFSYAYDAGWIDTSGSEPAVVPLDDRYQVWQIIYVDVDGVTYVRLAKIANIPTQNKFSIRYGTQYSNTSWYKDALGTFKQVPLLTAIQDTLYYQDGTDPEIFGSIKLIELTGNSTLLIDNIIGKKTYTSPNGVVFTNGLKVVFRGDVEPASYYNQEYYVSGVGTAIELLPVGNFVCPETYVVDANDSTIATEPGELDYLTISRASKDLNAWTRSNRWFHIDVINATAEYNNTTAALDNNYRAKRPIIQFRPGIRLFNMGTQGKAPVDVIDFEETDAFSNIEGSTSYSIDGYSFVDGTRVIFAADEDYNVRNKIYVVSFVTPDTVDPLIAQPIIVLTPASDGDVLANESTVCLAGNTLKGLTFWYDGSAWAEAQLKSGVQQAPLFDVYDADGVSFSNQTKYQSSTFVGSKLFSYAVSDTGLIDPVLKFPLQYLNINNVGDIVFENNLYKDTFLYVLDNVSVTTSISSGSAREYADRTVYQRLIGWQTAETPTQIRQQFKFTYNTETLKLDIKVSSNNVNIPAIKLYVGSVFQDPSTYQVLTTSNSTVITLLNTYTPGDIIEVEALSDQTSQVGFYQVASNLESNPLNGNSDSFTLGTIRTHYESICQNIVSLSGKINGANNSRDLGNIVPYGLIILQQSAPLTLAGYFLRSTDYNIFAALQYNSREYTKFKGQMLEAVTQQNIQFQTTSEILNTAIADITLGKIETQPFYWSDMIPAGQVYTTTTYKVTVISTDTFDTVQVYDYTSSNYLGMNVYLNNVLLTRGLDYTVATDGPRITILTTLTLGDTVTIQEYTATYGSFVPNTPTKLGLYPAWRPEIIAEKTTTGTQTFIRGHDGSLTKTFDDLRDQVLLEFETRIYNNLKLDSNPVPLTIDDVLPGQFRDTGFSFEEINNIFAQDFLSYCGWNKLDYKAQNYSSTNEFSWNYSDSKNKLNNENLLGAWRGINRYFYDTQQPQLTPWEMLGFSIEPDWWEETYGAGPYTEDNLVLWDDLAAGYVADPAGPYFKPEYARPASYGPATETSRGGIWGVAPYPSLSPVIPTGSQGELLSPFDSVVGNYDQQKFRKSWALGDGGPVEASWWNSSSYPFSVMHVLAVTRPAKFFALFADRDLYKYNTEFGQYLYNNRYRLDANGIEVYGNGVSKASYIDWIVDFNRQSGVDSTADLEADLANLDVRLCYRMASFSDKQYIKLYTEKSSPNSTNTTLLIPDESYDLLLYKNQPFDRTNYSSVVIQKVPTGYAVFGYSTTQPYFNIFASQTVGRLETITVADVSIRVPTIYTNTVVQVPYGFVFADQTSVADFLLSYGKFLESQGLTFDDRANGYTLSWGQMVQEFLYWSQQGWEDNALINLNPLATKLSVTKPQAVVDSIRTQTSEDLVLDQNRRELTTRNLNITRIDNTFTIQPLTDQTISYIDLRYTSYEHMIVLSNQSVFGDLIYQPTTGARQSRLSLVAVTTTDWNGQVDAQGFILNQDNVEEWTGLRTYSKGEIVKYKNVYWSALTIVQPSALFNYNDWAQSDYTQIELGMLPNLANKANQLQNTYNINTANIESDNDLLAYGLIGFRPRQYMAALNLDDVSQVNVYRQFLGTKGTILSAELFSQANLGKEAGDYNIYENWAVQRAVYGANANRSYVELRLDRALLNPNPSLVQVVTPQQQSQADQQILFANIWNQSYKLTSPDFLPTTTTLPTDIALPTAGYVNLNDADITVFDINDPASLAANINKIEVGTSIWVAKINNHDWNIYRAQQVPGQIQHVCDNLNGTSRVIFNDQHGLSAGDKLIIRFFDTEIDGVYTVLSVADLTTVNIAFTFTGQRTVANGTGIGFTLQTMRVAQASDIINLPYVNNILPGAKVWVDDNGSGSWEVLEKNQVFSDVIELAPVLLDATEQYGSSVAQATNRYAALVGSPRYGFGSGTTTGGVYVYVKNYSDQYAPVSPIADGDAILALADTTGVRGYGNAVDFGNQAWAVAGASASLGTASIANSGYACVIYRDPAAGTPGTIPYVEWQLLVPDSGTDRALAGEFGYSVAVSLDERWMYIGAPAINKVFAYGRVTWQDQMVRAVGDGVTTEYSIAGSIQIDAATQVNVTTDGKILALGTDYTVNSTFGTVTFTNPPALGTVVEITRISRQQLDAGTYYEVTQSATSGSGTGAEFTIVRQRGEVGQPGADAGSVGTTSVGLNYAVSDTITIAGASFGSSTDITLTVESVGTNGELRTFTIAYTPPALATVFSLNEYFFTVDSKYSFSVRVNDTLQRPNYDYTYSAVTNDLTFVSSPAAGAAIVVTAESYFEYVDEITVAGLGANDRFGQSISCTTDGRQIIIGAPYSTVDGEIEAGSTYVFDRSVQKFIYGSDPSSVEFTVAGSVTGPVSVIVNNVFLTNETDSIVGAPNTFSVSGNTITINADLVAGDIIEIETNQFKELQQINQDVVAEFSNFGAAVDLCSYNCSLYIGEPQSSVQIFKGGAVERSVNQSRIYGTITATVANPTLDNGDTIRVNNIEVAVPDAPNQNVTGLAAAINAAVPNVTATVSTTGYLTLSVKNVDAADPFNKLQVAPGAVGTTFADLGFETFAYTQTITSPYPIEFAAFGSSISVNDSATSLAVGAPKGTQYLETLFDDGTAIFDAGSTIFFSLVIQSGVVYSYDYLPSSTLSISNPGKFVFGDQIVNSDVQPYDDFGIALSYTSGVLMVGAPKNDAGDSAAAFGRVFVFENATQSPSWAVIREQQPVVDIQLLNSVFLYDRITSATTHFLDFFDPLQGKILGAARQNIDYIGAVNPASYNIGPVNITGTTWGADHVGEVWWDISTVRFIDPNQDDIVYASRRWGQVFPGSSIDVYQWIVSDQPPATYTGEGVPLNTLSYTINTRLTNDGTFATEYYYWVKGITTTVTRLGKTLPISVVAQYIENPRASGISYLAPINASTIALYNSGEYIEASDTIITIEFDREYTNDNVHVEYELIAQDREDGFLSDNLYRKLQDSFCGVDTAGNLVPDPTLGPAARYGVQFRPRQSMFIDRWEALKNYLTRANNVLALYPISESRTFTLLNSAEAEPNANSGLWDLRVANLEILSYQDIYAVALGYRYLVVSDSNNRGLWTIYTVESDPNNLGGRLLVLTRVQGYNTPDYWSYINWYLPGYNSSSKVITEVPVYSSLKTLSVPVGSSVKVTANAQGKWEIYLLTDLGWDRVGLQDGTIAFSAELWDYALGRFGFDVEVFDAQYFDQEPVIETRKIIQAINEELFIDDLAIERNRAMVLMFNYILSEFAAPEWLVKTSLIDVDHNIRSLIPYQNYVRDNQEFVSDYIQEVKPYHVQVREFNLKYAGFDEYFGDTTDFDVPAYYNTALEIPAFTSPILNVSDPTSPDYQTPYLHATAQQGNFLSDTPPNSTVWSKWPYSQWYNNYLLTLDSVEVVDGGSGYTEPPLVIVNGLASTEAEATAVINSLGQVVAINVINAGSGYRETPTITFDGGNGTGARAYPFMSNGLTRSFRTVIKYDRFQYQTSVETWSSSGTYENGTLVRYDDRVWRAANSDGSSANVGPTFNLEDWILVPASELSGVDRTMGYYVPGINEPGLELPLLVDGVDYPGVQVWGDYFLGTLPLDTNYQSSFTDIFLGTRYTDINVNGGEFVGPYEGHAPEELVNGAEYDTLDMRVYTRPGSDWQFDGHGFQIGSIRYTYEPAVTDEYSWQNVVDHPTEIIVTNQTSGLDLARDIDYTIDWVNQTVTIIQNVISGDVIDISVYEVGGGSQLYRENYTGVEVDQTVVIPVNSAEIFDVAVFVNGTSTSGVTWEPYVDSVAWDILNTYSKLDIVNNSGSYYRALQAVPAGIAITNTAYWFEFVPTLQTLVDFGTSYGATDGISLVALGVTTPEQYSWSTPQTEYFVADSQLVNSRVVTVAASMEGTNPANIIVTRNGIRLQPAEGIEWIGDDSSVEFGLPQRGGYQQAIITASTDVSVWVDNVLQTQSVGPIVGDYSVTNWTGSNTPGRQVLFNTPPAAGARILISVDTIADYEVVGNQIQIISTINLDDVISVTTWNDTAQQNILTQVFVGPIETGVTVIEPYDSTPFSVGSITGDPGSFDYSLGTSIPVNDFNLGREGIEAGRLWVTLDGYRLFEGEDFTVEGQYLILASGPIGATQVLAVTEFTNSIVPEAIAFRIFQDMRGVQATYRITAATTTLLSQDLSADADIAYVENASALGAPDLPNGIFGLVTIDGERIMYRERDTVANTISGLRRGTAGTGAADHSTGADIYDIGRGNLMAKEFQDYVVSDSAMGDGSTTVFYAPNIDISDFGDSSSIYAESIEVYVGGIRQYNYSDTTAESQYRYIVTDVGPLAIEFVVDGTSTPPLQAPPDGVEVTILQRRGVTWYAPGAGTPSNGVALQETDTQAARFLRGL